MPKRSANEIQGGRGARIQKTTTNVFESGQDIPDVEDDFEDAWEDEFESESGDSADDGLDGAMDVVKEEDEEEDVIEAVEVDEQEPEARPFILGLDKLGEGETLEADDSVYVMRHSMALDSSCFSVDILRDNLGYERHRLPTSAYIVAGTQDNRPQDNSIKVIKMSSLYRTQTHDSEDDDDEDDEDLDEDPVVEQRSIPHTGAVNRIRAQRLATPDLPSINQPYYAASFSDTCKVHIYNIRPHIEALDTPGYTLDRGSTQSPIFTVNSHKSEGYAMDWNAPSSSSLSLLTGDNDFKIYLTTAANADFRSNPVPFLSHSSFIDDLQWSPTEITVFASCSADRSIRMWDIRSRARQSVASIMDSHGSDVNSISWNRSTSYLLVSGDDTGIVKVWDLRNVKETAQAQVAHFNWHKAPITSIEWHPTDDSVFAASGDDNQVTLWDLALEADDDLMTSGDGPSIPPQLLFWHYQERVKEMHWHPQIPGAVISSGIAGLDVFKADTF